MMTDVLYDLGKTKMKSIEISLQIAGAIGSGCSVGGDVIFSLVALAYITFHRKSVDVLFHTILEKRTFDPVIGFGKPGVPTAQLWVKHEDQKVPWI